jgi:hypothetical protein
VAKGSGKSGRRRGGKQPPAESQRRPEEKKPQDALSKLRTQLGQSRVDATKKKDVLTKPRSSWWLAPLILAVVTLILFRAVIFGGNIFVSPDASAPLGFVTVGEKVLYQDGVYPLWNPYVFMGMPSFASLAYNPLIYPPDWPIALLQKALPLPDLTWLLLYYFLGGLGVYLLCREWGTGRWGAVFAGAIFLSMPNLIAVGAHGHGSQLVDSAYIPWLLWLTARLFRRGRVEDLAWLALAAGFQLLRGHVQICYYTWLTIGLYALFELLRRDRPDLPIKSRLLRLVGAGAGLGLGAALAAFLYLPVREYAKFSIRGATEGGGVAFDYATAWSFTPLECLTFLVPGAVGFGGPTYWGTMPFTDYPHYMGLGVLALALIGLVRAKKPAVQIFLVALGLVAILVSLGKHGFLYPLLYEWLPYFNKFRVPVMVLLLLQVATVCLAAFGFDAILEKNGDARVRRRVNLSLTILTAGAAVIFLAGLFPDAWRGTYEAMVRGQRPEFPAENLAAAFAGTTTDAVRVGIIALGTLIVANLYRRDALPRIALLILVFAPSLFDLWYVDERVMKPVLGPPSLMESQSGRDDIVDFLTQRADTSHFRVLPIQEFQSNRFAGFGLASVGGYHAAKPKLAQDCFDAEAHFRPFRSIQATGEWSGDGFLRVANVEYIIVPGYLPPGTPLEQVHEGSQVIYRNPLALPRVSLATEVRVAPAEEHLDSLLSAGYDPAARVLLEKQPEMALGPPGGSVRITSYGLNSVRMEAETPGPAVLRFADLYFPGWQVEVDGQPAAILRSDFAFRAVVLPGGRHQVEWRYESRALRQGSFISVGALVLVLGLLAFGFWQRKRTPQQG